MNRPRVGTRLLAMVGGAVGLITCLVPPSATADDRMTIPMPAVYRLCDFTGKTYISPRGYGQAVAFVGTSQHQVVADVQLFTARADTRYNVRLIQTPRPSLTCAGGDPGVLATTMDTDATGAATLTLKAPMLPGTTGAWVFIDLGSEFSQTPEEFYTSDFMAHF